MFSPWLGTATSGAINNPWPMLAEVVDLAAGAAPSSWWSYAALAVVPLALLLRRRTNGMQAWFNGAPPTAIAIEPRLMPIGARVFFDTQTPALERLGLRFIADSMLTAEPRPVYCRYLVTPDGCTYAELAVAQRTWHLPVSPPDLEAITLVTTFEDGSALQTCDLSSGQTADVGPDADGVCYQYRPGLSPSHLLQEHLDGVARHERLADTPAVPYPPRQIVEVGLSYAEYQQACMHGFAGLPAAVADSELVPAIPSARPLAYLGV